MTTITSLYIPHVFSNIDEARIIRVFDSLSIGKIKNIDFVAKTSKDGLTYNAAYIHLDSWHETVTSQTFQERIINPDKEARLVYDEPWYWIVLENRSVKGKRKLGDTKNVSTPVKKNHFIKQTNKMPLTFLECVKRNLIGDFDMEDTALINAKSMLYDEERHIISIDSRYVQGLEQTIDDLQKTTTSHEDDLYQYKISVMQDEIDSLRERITMLEDSQFNSIV